MNFVPRERSSFDEQSGVSILRPRILPGSGFPENDVIEYDYVFLRDKEKVGWAGCVGTWETFGTGKDFNSIYTLDLGSPSVFSGLIRFKKTIGNDDDFSTFFGAVARGMVNAFAGQNDNSEQIRYVAFISAAVLDEKGIKAPEGSHELPDGRIVVADVTVPAHPSIA